MLNAGMRDEPIDEIRPVFQRWYAAAVNKVATKDFDTSRSEDEGRSN
jgi:hypothetical protein